jgi:hypothetical protein
MDHRFDSRHSSLKLCSVADVAADELEIGVRPDAKQRLAAVKQCVQYSDPVPFGQQ